jgi:hypothetical protein
MTDWLEYKMPSGGLPTLECVTTWRGYVAGTYPMQVYWAGADGSLWRSTTDPQSGFVQMNTNSVVVTRMAIDDRETIYAVNSSGKPVKYGNEAWASLDLGDNSEGSIAVTVAVATDDDTAWFVMREGQYYVYGPAMATIEILNYGFKAVAPTKAPNSSDSNSVGSGWAVLGWGQLAYAAGDDNGWVFKSGDSERISGLVDVSTSVGYAWLLKTDGSVWATKSGFDEQSVGTSFRAKNICGGQGDYCFAVGTDGKPYRTTNSTPMG